MVWLLLHGKRALLHIDTLVIVEEDIENARLAIAEEQLQRCPPGLLEILTLINNDGIIALRHNGQRLEHRGREILAEKRRLVSHLREGTTLLGDYCGKLMEVHN